MSINKLSGSNSTSVDKPQVDTSFSRTAKTGLLGASRSMSRGLNFRGGGEAVQGVMELFRKTILAGVPDPDKSPYKLFVFDKMEHQTAASAILIALVHGAEGAVNRAIAVYQVIIESSMNTLNPLQIPFGPNRQIIEIQHVCSDIPNDTWVERVVQSIRNTTKVQKVVDAGCTVLHKEFSEYTDGQKEERAAHILSLADQALHFHLNLFLNGSLEEPWCLKMFDSSREYITANVIYNPEPVSTADGLPVRSDIKIITTNCSKENSSNNSKINSSDSPLIFGTVSAYVDFAYVDPKPPAYGMPPVTQRYVPNVVISRVETTEIPATLETMLFAMIQSMVLSNIPGWIPVFRNRLNQDESLRDIGSFGYEIPQLTDPTAVGGKGKLVNTKTAHFGAEDLVRLLQYSTFMNKTIYSIDIEDCGDLSFIGSIFALAAEGVSEANALLFKAADNLTGGAFSTRVGSNKMNFILNDQNRIHLGYYTDSHRIRKDLRELDYLAILTSFGDTNINAVVDWSRTMDPTTGPLEQRIANRWAIIQGISPTAVLKGYARRYTFNATVLGYLLEACSDCGVAVSPNNMHQMNINSAVRGISDMVNRAFDANQINKSMFGSGLQPNIENGIGGYNRMWRPQGF